MALAGVEYFDADDKMVARAVDLIHSALTEAVDQRGTFIIALSGGNTPRPVYEEWARRYGSQIQWKSVFVYFGDERMVPCDSPESNYRMACDSLLDRVDIPPWNIHRIQGELNVQEAARLYDEKLHALAEEQVKTLPVFDLILLGLGPDAHTASLFPGTEALSDDTHLAAPVVLPADSQGQEHAGERVTMTYPTLNASRSILFLVAGDDKAEALRRVEMNEPSAPAAAVRPSDGPPHWLIVRPTQAY